MELISGIPLVIMGITLVSLFVYPIYAGIVHVLDDKNKLKEDSIWIMIDGIWGGILLFSLFIILPVGSLLMTFLSAEIVRIILGILYIAFICVLSCLFYMDKKGKLR